MKKEKSNLHQANAVVMCPDCKAIAEHISGYAWKCRQCNMAFRDVYIVIGNDHFTDENIRKWATGDLTDIDFATGEESLIIEYLSLIIVERILSA